MMQETACFRLDRDDLAAVVHVDCVTGLRLAAAFGFLGDFDVKRLVKGEGHSGQEGEEGVESHYKAILCF